MVCVFSPSRLHIGLLSLPSGESPPGLGLDLKGEAQSLRHYGGAGLMVQDPGIRVVVQPAERWLAEGPLAERALFFAKKFASSFSTEKNPCAHIVVEECPREHAGLGTGTQLGLAVSRGLALMWGKRDLPAVDLAVRIGRGRRSALGIHGFDGGGFLVDGGKGPNTVIAPLVAQTDFPDSWRIILAMVPDLQGLHGPAEQRVFAQCQQNDVDRKRTDTLCRLVLLGMLPALKEEDLTGFGEALYDFNRQAGELFRSYQGGTYAHPRIAALVDFVRRQGVAGVGQSSWGPTVFAVTTADRASDLAGRMTKQFAFQPGEIIITRAAKRKQTTDYADNTDIKKFS